MTDIPAEETKDTTQFQVITDELDFNSNFDAWLKQNQMHNIGTNYRIIAVIGCQSSGKSTLLNLLFDTEFEVMDESRGRQQTTKGIWMNRNSAGNMLVLDIEGTDSKERGEQRMTFEQTTSLFALAMADVLLINMWTTDIGRYGASNYGLLKVIFEVNLKLFDQHSSKKLLFVLRDFDSRIAFDTIKQMIDKDLKQIWSEIYKPEKYANSQHSDFFSFEFAMMPHKIFQPDDFMAKATELRGRFDEGAADTLFLTSSDSNIPADGLPIFIDQTWQVIRQQKDLNLPGQREMVANYRCGEMKEEALGLVAKPIEDLSVRCSKEIISNFGTTCQDLVNTACSSYGKAAKQYNPEVFKKIEKELEDQLLALLYHCFDSQLKLIRQQTHQMVGNEIKKMQAKPLEEVADHCDKILERLIQENMKNFKRKATSLVVQNSNWGDKVDLHAQDLSNQLETLAQNCKDKLLSEVSKRATKAHEDQIKEMIHSAIENLDDGMVGQMKDGYAEKIEMFNENLQDILRRGFGMTRDEVFQFLVTNESNAHDFCIKELKSVFASNVPQSLLRKFNKTFKKDEDDKLRDWVKMEEADIQVVFNESKKSVDNMFEQFKGVFFPTGITQMEELPGDPNASEQGPPTMEDLMNDDFSTTSTAPKRQASLVNIASIRILTANEIGRVKTKFLEEADMALAEAIRAHKNIQSSEVPIWLWVALAWFASDNVAGYLMSPIIFYPFILLCGVAVILHQLGILKLLIDLGLPQVKTTVNAALARTPLPFRL